MTTIILLSDTSSPTDAMLAEEYDLDAANP